MLKLVNIVKDYEMKDQEPVHALKGLSIDFRRNEFVAILGPSGCGKTTLLNIIGGLDRYTNGDLIIQGKSTKNYKEGDWDTYRNHSIGFVFQSYNLIAHQSIVRNVELALTIGGISKEERRQRAYKALEKVGLKGLEKKKPNQLSGGQMQRVAIARALINDPEILLADEPTGALDSETSIQVMDLLKEVAKDCLVIMVTHNPELANAYASRIVKMKDGLLLSDSKPFDGNEEIVEKKVSYRCPICKTPLTSNPLVCPHCGAKIRYPKKDKTNKGSKKNSSMSFFTATGLSVANLVSKLKRTVLVAIAGSIGIIGVSAVLAVSNGVHGYIDKMQNDMISQYPISIAESSIDYTTLLTGLSNDDQRKIVDFAKEYEVGLDSLINYLMDKYKDFTSIKTNDINEDLLEYVEAMPKEYYNSINRNYNIDMTNNIFTTWQREPGAPETKISLNGLTQMYISELGTVPGFSQYATFVDLFTDFMKEIPADKDYILGQYDILAGTYPESENDIVLVVDENQTLTDLIYAQMGFFTEKEFIDISRKAIEEHEDNPDPEKIVQYSYPTSYTFDQILGKELVYYPHDSIWNYETIYTDVVAFDTVIPYGGNNLNVSFFYQYDSVLDCLSGTIGVEGYNINADFFRREGTVDPSNPFKGEWGGELSLLQLSLPFNFTIDDTNVIIHFATDLSYEQQDNQVSFTIENQGSTGNILLEYNVGSDTLVGTYNTEYKVGDTTIPIHLPLTVNRIEGEKGANPVLGTWYGELNAPGMGIVPLKFALKENKALTFYYDTKLDYEAKVQTVEGYMYNAEVQEGWTNGSNMRISAILKKKAGVNFGCLSRGVYYTRALTNKMINDAKDSQIVANEEHGIQNYINSSYEKDRVYSAYVKYKYTSYRKGDGPKAVKNVEGHAMALNTNLSGSLTSMFSITGVNNKSLDKAYLRSLSGKAYKDIYDEDGNLIDFTCEPLPSSISIYPTDFTKKSDVTSYLKKWNENVDISLPSGKVLIHDDRQELSYTDTVEIIVNVINTLINIVTIALISFTSLALVVSCFMIAVITYISTMERVKEIGVIRSLGGRKKDVSRLFVAECLIIGLSSGLIGIAVTYLLQLIINIIITSLNVGVTVIANLPILTALIMIGVSILLNVISGLIPAMKASNQDPVAALRSE